MDLKYLREYLKMSNIYVLPEVSDEGIFYNRNRKELLVENILEATCKNC